MTHLSTYGVGAGRMVSATSDDEESRVRQRRLTAAQLSEQARKSAALREQLMQAEKSAALDETRQLQREQERDVSTRRDRQVAVAAKTADRHAPTEVKILPAHAPSTEVKSLPAHASSPAHAQGDDESKPLDDRQRPGRSDEPLALTADSEADRSHERVRVLTARLIDELPAWRAQGTTTVLEKQLDALRQSVLTLRPSLEPDSREALDSLAGSLEFVQGYLEASSLSGDTRQRLMLVIDGVREDVAGVLSDLAGLTAAATPTVAAAVLSSTESLRTHGLARRDRHTRAEAAAPGRPAVVSDDDESEAAAASGASWTMPPAPVQPARDTVTSQHRDIDKRRNETPVSVAVRSI